MNSRAKKQLTILIMVAMLLVLLMVAAVFLMPNGKVIKTVKNPAVQNVTSEQEQGTNKFDFVGRIFDEDMNPLANSKFVISCGPTEFTTDENGYFRLNGLPVGVYKLYALINGEQVGETEIQLSNDGCFAVGYVFFEDGAIVTMIFDGKGFKGIELESDSGEEDDFTPEENQNSNVGNNLSDLGMDSDEEDTSSDSGINEDHTSENENIPEEEEEEPEDPTYTNLSWMKDVPFGFGAYGLNTTYSPEYFMKVVTDPQYDYVNTFLVSDGSLDQAIFEAKLLTENNKNFFLNVHDLLSIGDPDIDKNLSGKWRYNLNRWAAHLYEVGGDCFQGFYFDEVDLYLNEKDFTRVTKYMREHFGLRTFAVHRRDPFTIPASMGMHISKYKGTRFVIDSENHKYVTDVGWWWYGGYKYYGYNAERLGELWQDAMELLDPNTRKWIVPPVGSFDFRHSEEDALEVAYAMYREASKVKGFGGLMFYTMQCGGLWGGYGKITPDSEKLTDDDFLKDENGEFVLDADGNKIVDIKENNSITAVRDGRFDYSVEGGGAYWVLEQNEDGTYNWPMMRKYFEILGKGITSGENRTSILEKLDDVYKPDYSKYK